MPAAHWAFVVERARHLGINPNAWMTRMVRKQMELKEVMPEQEPVRPHPPVAPASRPTSRLKGEWKAP